MSRDASRAIVVAYHYPPDPAVGSLRARNVAQALAAAGYEVSVVSIARPDAPAEAKDGAVTVVRVVPSTSPRRILAALNSLITRIRKPVQRSAPHGKQPESGAAWKSPDRVSTIKRWVGAITWLPDDAQGFIVPAARAVARLMRGDGRDVLYTTGPPFSDHLVGLFARRRRRFRWILEFRDPWTDINKPWFVRSKLTDVFERWLERRCITLCDGIVPVASAYADILVARYGAVAADKMLVVRNGIPNVASLTPSDPARFRILHAGSFYIGRDPRAFLTALSAIRARGGLQRRVDVQFVGDCRYFRGEPLAPDIERLGLSDAVTFADWLPHKESVELMSSADLLLLLAQDQPLSVPNKLYEYLGTGKLIFAIADRDGETVRLLREVGGHFIITEDDTADTMERAVAEALATPPSRDTLPSPALAMLSTANQMKKLTEWLERLA